MANYGTNEFKPGLKLTINGDPCSILGSEFVKPGKGQAFTRVKLRNLKTGRVLEKTYKSGDSVPAADVMDVELQYLYNDGELWYFMDTSSYEQIEADRTALGDAGQWLTGEEICGVTLWNDAPLSVQPPNFVELRITETDPGLRETPPQAGQNRLPWKPGPRSRCPCSSSRTRKSRWIPARVNT